jgi:hypothetical protein
MALELVQSGREPLGQFDGHDDIYLTVLGGEVGTITGVTIADDSASSDVDDGYVGTTRPVITTNLTSGDRPLGLVDEGISGYGTMFGSVLGGIAGSLSAGQNLGPHTATGSGKLTFWDKMGTYAVTLDAVDPADDTGLQPENATLAIGDALYATTAGLLTPNVAIAFENVVLGRFLNFETFKGGSLVNTPVSLVSATNSPVGQGQPQGVSFARALITFNPPA